MEGGLLAPLGSSRPEWPGEALRLAAVSGAYFAVASLSLKLEFEPEGIAAIWPPSGIFLSAVLWARRGLKPLFVAALTLADLVAERLSGTPWPVSAAYALTLACDASLGAWLLLRVLGGRPTFQRVRDFVALVVLSVVLGNGLTSLVAAEASQHLAGAASFWTSWLWWAASGGIGNLLVTPLLLAAPPEQPARRRGRAAAELAVMLALLAGVELLAFARLQGSSFFPLLLVYSTFPFLLWAALRLGVRAVAAALVVIAAVTVAFAAGGRATIIHDSSLGAVIAVQLYLAVMAVPSLFLAAVVAERRRAEGERERLRGQVDQTQRLEAIGRLSGGVAHDFNNMLTVILGRTSILLEELEPAHPVREHLLDVQDAALRSSALTRQLLAFARKQTAAPKVLELNDRIAEMLKMLRRLIGEEVELTFSPGAGLGLVRIDPAQVDQVLANLCVNARDAILGAGAVTGRIAIETSNVTLDDAYRARHLGAGPGDYVMLSVADDGSGMPPEVVRHVFEPFFTTKEGGRGTGLGLSTVYGIVRQNGGAIDVYSEPGVGTTFKIYLPRLSGAAVSVPAAAAVAAPERSRGETVLVVEDEPAVAALTRTMLERLGYAVLGAATPAEALRVAEGHAGEVHLLLTDVVLPQMNGRDLAAHLQALRPGLRCLFMSGHSTSVITRGGFLEEGVSFLQKPFSAQELAAKVRELLGAG